MITCNLCGLTFSSIEEYESHIDMTCAENQNQFLPKCEFICTQITYPNGKTEFKILGIKPELSDDILQRKKSDEDLTAPKSAMNNSPGIPK
jgi:hypothetical protein